MTTGQDLLNACNKCGFKSVKAIKFYENRSNGQSKGYAILTPIWLNVSYYSIALVELANETAAEQACTKLSETLVFYSYKFIMFSN